MKLLLNNIRIINPFSEPEFIENGFIAIVDDTIDLVGSTPPKDMQFDRVIDLEGKTVLPGMINAHTHLYSALALGMPAPQNSPTNFVEILQEIWWKLDRALDEESTRASFEVGLVECLRSGVTTVFDHHSSQHFITGSLNLLSEIATKSGVNLSTAFEITDRNGSERFEAGLAENLSSIQNVSGNPFVHPMVGLHASFTLSDDSLKAVRSAIREIDNPGIHIHVAEDRADEKDAREKGYPSVVHRLHHFELINEKSLIIHGLHLLPRDIKILEDSGAALIHNPTSNANNRVGMLSEETIRTLKAGLGTDGMQANLLAEAKEGTLIRSSHLAGSVDNVNYPELLFSHNPRIATKLFSRKIGHIAPGYQADLAIYDYRPRTQIHAENLLGHLLFRLDRPSDVMTRGEFRVRNHEFVNLPEKEIKENARLQSQKLWGKMKAL